VTNLKQLVVLAVRAFDASQKGEISAVATAGFHRRTVRYEDNVNPYVEFFVTEAWQESKGDNTETEASFCHVGSKAGSQKANRKQALFKRFDRYGKLEGGAFDPRQEAIRMTRPEACASKSRTGKDIKEAAFRVTKKYSRMPSSDFSFRSQNSIANDRSSGAGDSCALSPWVSHGGGNTCQVRFTRPSRLDYKPTKKSDEEVKK